MRNLTELNLFITSSSLMIREVASEMSFPGYTGPYILSALFASISLSTSTISARIVATRVIKTNMQKTAPHTARAIKGGSAFTGSSLTEAHSASATTMPKTPQPAKAPKACDL